ncbi:hypothetical protein LUPAC06_04273 [Micromonospora saelicesensis]|uniref:helix-turn-helix domain-containing protein n=1 Tax=Micromonospora saelicesensis TaxID=285676 RepID=UPI000DC0114B|nr:leucine zipper domain-containing protein [Micromonospora saelicesensis]RAO54971.1 hypothetical protein LUPAC06_04273 [Micromonospora saelicesensis]
MGLAELSVMEQPFHAVMECLGGTPKTEVAARYGVSRQTIHNWLGRYAAEGIKGVEDRSHRPHVCPHRVDASTEALVCELRRSLTVVLDENTVTVYDADTPIKAVPRRSTTDLNRTKAKHQITTNAQP